MEIRTEHESPLKLEKLIISECRFARSEDSLENLKLNVRVGRQIEPLGMGKYRVILELFIGDKDEKLEISVKCLAHFETMQEYSPLIGKNTLAIMFPYIRSYISTITAQPGMSPIVLPPMNIVSMFQNE